MAAELLNILLGFQADAPELQQKREYDRAAREFVTNISNISPSNYLKATEAPNDILGVSGAFSGTRFVTDDLQGIRSDRK